MRSNLRNTINYLRLINEIRLADGVSYNVNTQELNPVEGYMVSIPGHEETVSTIDEETVASYIKKHSTALAKPNSFFGCWYDGHGYVLDVSERYERKRDAVFYALMYNQRAVWDCARRDEIRVNPRKSIVKQ